MSNADDALPGSDTERAVSKSLGDRDGLRNLVCDLADGRSVGFVALADTQAVVRERC